MATFQSRLYVFADTTNVTTLLKPTVGGRQGALIFNDSASTLYIVLGDDVPSSTRYSVKLAPGDYYELPFGYSGSVVGVWSADASGSAYVTELL